MGSPKISQMGVPRIEMSTARTRSNSDPDRLLAMSTGHLSPAHLQSGAWSLAGAAAVGYALGLLPSAALAARVASGGKVDLRASGTGNPGGANAAAVLGRRWGYGVMAADIAKGAVACRLGRRVGGDIGQHVAAVSAVVGHCYPVTHGFRGGKGVATSVGQCLMTLPAYVPIDLGVAAVVAAGPWRQRALPATMAASATWVAASIVWWRRQLPNAWGGPVTIAHPLAAAASSAIIATRFLEGRRP
jgi:glycerol-3-phosphate acyltransferase PlsY